MGATCGASPCIARRCPTSKRSTLLSTSVAPSGLTFYTGDRFPGWKRNVFVGGMREGEIARSGQIQRLVFNDKWEEMRREPLLRELHQRVRDIRQGPDGLLYLITEEDQAALLRIEPVPGNGDGR